MDNLQLEVDNVIDSSGNLIRIEEKPADAHRDVECGSGHEGSSSGSKESNE